METASDASEFVIKFKKSIIAAQKVNSLDVSVVEKLWNELIYVEKLKKSTEIKRNTSWLENWKSFSVGAFLKKRVDYSQGVWSVFFFRYT